MQVAIGTIAKALLAGALAFLGALATAANVVGGFGTISASEWITAAIAGLVAIGAVYSIPNKPTP